MLFQYFFQLGIRNVSQTGLSLRACGSNAAVIFLPHRIKAIIQLLLCDLWQHLLLTSFLLWHWGGIVLVREKITKGNCVNTVKGRVMLYYLTPDSRSIVFSLYRRTCGMLTEIKRRIVYRLRKAETGALLVQPDTC